MGQKVHPLGFRRSNFAFQKTQRAKDSKIPLTPLLFSISKGGPRPAKGKNASSKKLHEDFVIEGILVEFFKKSGFLISTLNIFRNFKELQIVVELFEPLTPLKAPTVSTRGDNRAMTPLWKKGSGTSYAKGVFQGGSGFAKPRTEEKGKALDLEVDILTKFLEKFTFQVPSRPFPQGVTLWKITILNEVFSIGEGSLVQKSELDTGAKNPRQSFLQNVNFLTKSLKNYRKEFFFTNGVAILAITFLRPNASLLANFMATVMEDLPKGQAFIDFIGQGLGALFAQEKVWASFNGFKGSCEANRSEFLGGTGGPFRQGPVTEADSDAKGEKVKGILVKVKGRINGSDRSRTSSYRYGSIPLHTIEAAIDYGFAFTKSSYGVSSIKVWLFYGTKGTEERPLK